MIFHSTNATILVALLLALPVHLMPLADDEKDAENNNSSGLTASGIMKGLTTGLALSSCLPGTECARPIERAQGAPTSYIPAQAWAPQPLAAAQQLDQKVSAPGV
ncbi:hypothetical protein niasHS_016804 [Heterodera schachtii]|uniref:Gland protein n=1 Tax=Heterodera schachtii TaxID=97005 RepID=A0ABD2HVN5_HETSC